MDVRCATYSVRTMQVNEQMRIITLDIKDLYVSLPIQGIIRNTKFWLNKNINNSELIEKKRASLTLYVAQRTSIARLILNSIRLTQYRRHAATTPTQRNDV